MAHSDGADRQERKLNEQGYAASGRLREPTLLTEGGAPGRQVRCIPPFAVNDIFFPVIWLTTT